jgi:two-component system NtrC family sensor kinase
MPVAGTHDHVLVALSVLIAAFASYTALDLAGRVQTARDWAYGLWLSAAAVAMGGGIWSMHFIAMLAFSMPVQVNYDVGLTLFSLVLPIAVTGMGFWLIGRRSASWPVLIVTGIVMGIGIAAMHYIGMAAMRMRADLGYDSFFASLSILIAIGASTVALWLAARKTSAGQRVLAAGVMGLAVSGMHYTAMHAAVFTAHSAVDEAAGHASLAQSNLALAVAAVTFTILLLGLVASLLGRSQATDAIEDPEAIAAHFQRVPRYFLALLFASVLVPTVVLGLAAWQNWHQLEATAEERAQRTVGLMAEHALKVFENNEQLLSRIDERLRGLTPEQIGSAEIGQYFTRLANEVDHVEGVGVVGADGRLVAVSGSFPAPPLDLRDRDYVAGAIAAAGQTHVAAPVRGQISGQNLFRMARLRAAAGGSPGGVLFASMAPEYFVRFYRSVIAGEDSVTMGRADGTVLVRDPPVTTGVEVMSPQSGFMRGIARNDRGLYRTTSELDRITRIHAYQRIGAYPVYVSYGLSLAGVAREWRANLLTFGFIAALAALSLSSLSLFALRAARQERRIFARWQEETGRRETAEEALRQSQKMEAVGQLTGGIAHDFNNLLTVVIGNLDFAARAVEGSNLPKAHRNIEAARQGAQRAAGLTHRLLAFSRRQPLQPQAVNLNRLVGGMSDLFRRTLGGGLWLTSADQNQLESALLNLVINARDAMPVGGKLTIETANCHLDEGYAFANAEVQPGQYVMAAVTDTGTGMPREVLEKVFEPFFTTKEVGQGTGLGLSMVYGFVKQSGGHVKIYSEPGQGTTVKIYLPRLIGEEVVDEREVRELPRAEARETVLVVEDDNDVRAYTVESLTTLGYRVLEARDANSALATLQSQESVTLLFTDIGLPGLDGRQLAEEVHRLRPDLPVLFTTGYARNAVVHNNVLDQGVHLLTKPFTTEQLANKARVVIREAIERKASSPDA